ncbi:MAG: DUF4325 domain-containing protein [Patescibacteria group bacterium]|nr:DUF4325 domain-containing protein [Patescibacteria group bacterium]
MIIELKKFGIILNSRQSGREALMAFSSNLENYNKKDKIYIDFSDLASISPSWGDEFLVPIFKKFPDKMILKKGGNASVSFMIDILEKANNIKFNWE